MKPEHLALRKPIFWALSVCVAFVIGGSLINRFDLPLVSKPQVSAPDAPLSQVASIFPCINSLTALRQPKRIAVLHGPDWVLESTVAPSCLPEREVVFSTEVGEQFLRHSVTSRTRLWVTKNGEVVCVRIVESSGSEKQDMIAVDLVTNHKCSSRTSKNCLVQGRAAVMTM
jgi:hypothetical protein